jgi:hypothetical protein
LRTSSVGKAAQSRQARRSKAFAAAVECLEPRRLLSTTYDLTTEIHDPDVVTDAMAPAAMTSAGNLILVGSYFRDAQGDSDLDGLADGPLLTSTGLARLYDATTGAVIRTFYNPDPQAGDSFGRAVAIAGSSIAITSAEADGRGKVFVYDSAADTTPTVIVGPYLTVDQAPLFGDGLEAYGDDLLIAVMNRGTTDSAGQVFLYDLANIGAGPTWTYAQDVNNDRLGHAMDSDTGSGRVLLASDGTDSSLGGGSTVIEVAIASSTVEQTYESPVSDSDNTFGGQFTTAVAFAGSSVLIGSAAFEQVYQLSRATALPVRTYDPTFRNLDFPLTGFGTSVVVSGDLAIMGASIEPGAFDLSGVPAYAGAAYVFDHTTGDLDAHITNPTSPTVLPEFERFDEFGAAVGALSDGRWAVLDPSDSSDTALNGGGIYVFAPQVIPPGPSIDLLPSGDLVVTGTGDAEAITITKDALSGGVTVTIGTLTATVSPTGQIIVMAGDGADTIQVGGSVLQSVLVFGGGGDDSIKGGGGNDMLVGGDGEDMLVGGTGRDLIMGGEGADRIVGNTDDDILVAGPTTFDDDPDALASIMDEWTSGHSYANRVNNLTDGSGSVPELNDGVYLNATTAFADGEVDVLTGSAGSDWFLFSQDTDQDYATDAKSWEFSDDLPFIESL